MRCSQGDEVRDYFHIGIIGYNTDNKGTPIPTTRNPRSNRESHHTHCN